MTGRPRRAGGDGATRRVARPAANRRWERRSAGRRAIRRAADPPRSSDRHSDVLRRSLDQDCVLAVDLLELDPDDFLARGRHVLADVVRPDRQLAMTTVDEDRETDRLGPSEVEGG